MGSTSLSESLDPDDLRELTGIYHGVCEPAIRKHDGHIAQFQGDGVLAYFGYPVAHEDDARRAVRSGLEILSGLAALNGRLREERGIELKARLGIHTGPVAVGDVGGGEWREQLALGKTPNPAARIQNIAEPETVLVSEDTHRIVRFFDFTPLGAHELKGLAEVVTLYRVVGESGAESSLDAARRTGLTPLTGRDEEPQAPERCGACAGLQVRTQCWLKAKPGSGSPESWTRFAHASSAIPRGVRVLLARRTRRTRRSSLVGFDACSGSHATHRCGQGIALEARLALRGVLNEETSALMAAARDSTRRRRPACGLFAAKAARADAGDAVGMAARGDPRRTDPGSWRTCTGRIRRRSSS